MDEQILKVVIVSGISDKEWGWGILLGLVGFLLFVMLNAFWRWAEENWDEIRAIVILPVFGVIWLWWWIEDRAALKGEKNDR
jgi:hypothetical protein